jgi:23S rRNA (guanosine2251-2'-O)-methyltransferase
VGSIFRTADAAGVSKIYLTGITPAPVDRFGKKRKDVLKTSLGAEDTVPWQHFLRIGSLLTHLKKDGVRIVAVEQSEQSIDYKKIKHTTKSIAYIFGNEVRGLSSKILEKCDKIVEIQMHGKKESLNVSVSAGIILFSN